MTNLVLFALAGFAAQFIDGSLGMAYGVTSTSLLLLIGASPAIASASVHLSEIGTTLASGVSHWRMGNVDWRVVALMGFPGSIGAFAGATFLTQLSIDAALPIMSIILMTVGLYVLIRFSFFALPQFSDSQRIRPLYLVPLGLLGGFVDATGGGGWGPVGTPALLATARMEPRKVIGTIDASEFIVAIAATAGFFAGIGAAGFNYDWVLALLIGGVIAAPLAAWFVRRVHPRLLGALVGGLILFTNIRLLIPNQSVLFVVLVIIVIIWGGCVLVAARAARGEKQSIASLSSR